MNIRLNIRMMARASLLAAVTAVLAWVRIPVPLSPVPVTGQTLGVMLSGALLGPAGGAVSQGIYLALGLLGAPVLAGGSGWQVLIGPSGGFLWGFIPGAWTVGFLSTRLKGDSGLVVSLVAGGILIPYALGVGYLARLTGMGVGPALAVGALPFIPGDILKVVIALMLVRHIRRSAVLDLPGTGRSGM